MDRNRKLPFGTRMAKKAENYEKRMDTLATGPDPSSAVTPEFVVTSSP
jgi:hypothetical protein